MSLSTEEILEKMRRGYQMTHALQYGDFEFRIRLLEADEETSVIEETKSEWKKKEASGDKIKIETMKAILHHAGQSGGVSQLTYSLLNKLTTSELQAIYSKYLDVLNQVDNEFQEMDYEVVKNIVEDVRKKKLSPRKLSLRHLGMIGIFFLESLPPEGSDLGS